MVGDSSTFLWPALWQPAAIADQADAIHRGARVELIAGSAGVRVNVRCRGRRAMADAAVPIRAAKTSNAVVNISVDYQPTD
jgi:hypothetical protein